MVWLHHKRKQTDRFSVDTINSNRAYLFFIYVQKQLNWEILGMRREFFMLRLIINCKKMKYSVGCMKYLILTAFSIFIVATFILLFSFIVATNIALFVWFISVVTPHSFFGACSCPIFFMSSNFFYIALENTVKLPNFAHWT